MKNVSWDKSLFENLNADIWLAQCNSYDTKHKKDMLLYLLSESWCDTFFNYLQNYLRG
jgi:hypothetical protein